MIINRFVMSLNWASIMIKNKHSTDYASSSALRFRMRTYKERVKRLGVKETLRSNLLMTSVFNKFPALNIAETNKERKRERV
ncbi:hypothetical protein RIF29_22873 [Crotalaria pallida]|uniref:Uncharacterized protein n=1 Tax=Crotalaria pallida TaxID=3830 RepID=A0AAN9F6X6_CROPI